jgi:hypothetical protein
MIQATTGKSSILDNNDDNDEQENCQQEQHAITRLVFHGCPQRQANR